MEVSKEFIEKITQLVVLELKKAGVHKRRLPLDYNSLFENKGIAVKGTDRQEVIIGIGPAFGAEIKKTIHGIEHEKVIQEIMAGIEEEGMIPRILRVSKTSDVAFIGKEAAMLSGSGIAIGIQSKGTALIHQKDLYPLTNLELFPQAPLINLETYRRIGKNAARYAKGVRVKPIESKNDFTVRAKYQVKAALMHTKETEAVDKNRKTERVELNS